MWWGRSRRTIIAAVLIGILLAGTLPTLFLSGRATTARTVDVAIFDFFNVPAGGFPDYWQVRSNTYRREAIVSNEFPYLFQYTPRPTTDPGNFFLYGNYRMSVAGRALPEMTIDAPVILPRLGKTTALGGSAQVDLTMAFLTRDRWDALRATHPELPTWNFNDGWAAELRGTVTMDALGAAKILGLTGDPLAWWASNGAAVIDAWSTWLDVEGNERMDIYSGFRLPFAELFTDLTLTTSGSWIVLTIQHASWGIDALLARWMYWGRTAYLRGTPAGFLGFEGRYDRLSLQAYLGATADVDVVTDVHYGVRAWAASGSVGTADRAAWVWQPALLDVIPSRADINPLSEFDPYASLTYVHLTPGSPQYGRILYYEFTPAAWSLKAGERVFFALSADRPVAFFVPPSGSRVSGNLRLGATLPDLAAGYDSEIRVLRLAGPLPSGAPSLPAHGYPWIEFEMDAGGSGGSRRRLR